MQENSPCRRQQDRFNLQQVFWLLAFEAPNTEGTAMEKVELMAPLVFKDVSGGGFSFELDQFLAKGSRLWISMELPQWDQPLLGEASVVWAEQMPDAWRYGARFESVSDLSLTLLQNYLEALAH
jgi:hypothetical protein